MPKDPRGPWRARIRTDPRCGHGGAPRGQAIGIEDVEARVLALEATVAAPGTRCEWYARAAYGATAILLAPPARIV
jgi:hypothetical protein